MKPVRLRIDRVAIEIGEEMRAGEVEAALRTALALLATRLASAPFGGGDAPRRALELIELGPVEPDWIAGPGAAAKLAEELYQRILGAAR